MARIGDEQQFLLQHWHRHEIGCLDWKREEAQIAGSRPEHLDRTLGAADGHAHFEAGMNAPNLREKGREDIQADGHPANQSDRPTECLTRVADHRYRVLQVAKNAVAQLQQRFARGGDPDPPADAMKDRLAELVLQEKDLSADGGLRDVKLFAGRRK